MDAFIPEKYMVALVIFLSSVIGLYVNLAVAVGTLRLKYFRNPFGLLTALESSCNAGLMLIFATWVFITTMTGPLERLEWINRLVGRTSMALQITAFHTTLFLAVNRFTAVWMYDRYSSLFTIRHTLYLVAVELILAICYWTVFTFEGCDMTYNATEYLFAFSNDDCSVFLSKYIDFWYNMIIIAIGFSLDMVTFTKLKLYNKRIIRMFVGQPESHNEETHRRLRTERNLLSQAFLSSAVCGATMLCFHYVVLLFSHRVLVFIPITFVFLLSHAAAGLVMVNFNPEIKKRIWNPISLFHDEPRKTSVVSFVTVPPANNSATKFGHMRAV